MRWDGASKDDKLRVRPFIEPLMLSLSKHEGGTARSIVVSLRSGACLIVDAIIT